MKKYVIIIFAIALIVFASGVSAVDFDEAKIKGLNITSDVDGAFNLSKNENKTLAIIFEKDDCVYCDKFKSETLSNPDVQKILGEKCVILVVDTNKRPGIANKYKVFGTPTTVFLDSGGNQTARVEGYVPADEFLTALKEI